MEKEHTLSKQSLDPKKARNGNVMMFQLKKSVGQEKIPSATKTEPSKMKRISGTGFSVFHFQISCSY